MCFRARVNMCIEEIFAYVTEFISYILYVQKI